MPAGTPFMLLGDLNLVGDSQQLRTLVSGETVNVSEFGDGGPPDWDDSNLEDLLSVQTDKRTAYTWRNDGSSFSPGRLDFMIYTGSVMNVEKAYTLQTNVMPPERLAANGLLKGDTGLASDHLPKVADFTLATQFVPGDVTADGVVTVDDLVRVIDFILGSETPDSDQFTAADINNDGVLNVTDLIAIIQIILGIA